MYLHFKISCNLLINKKNLNVEIFFSFCNISSFRCAKMDSFLFLWDVLSSVRQPNDLNYANISAMMAVVGLSSPRCRCKYKELKLQSHHVVLSSFSMLIILFLLSLGSLKLLCSLRHFTVGYFQSKGAFSKATTFVIGEGIVLQ